MESNKQNISSITPPSFPPLLSPDCTIATISGNRAELFYQAISEKSTLNDVEQIPLVHPSSDKTVPDFRVLTNGVFSAFSGLHPWKSYELDGVSPSFFQNCFFPDAMLGKKLSLLLNNAYRSFLLEVHLRTRRVTTITLQTTAS